MAPEKREAFAEATGVNFRQARIWVFLLSSIGLGFIGGFYTAQFRRRRVFASSTSTPFCSVSPCWSSAASAVPKARSSARSIVVFFDKVLITLRPDPADPHRLDHAFGRVCICATACSGSRRSFATGGTRRRANAVRRERRKEAKCYPKKLPKTHDKDMVYMRRFDKMQRDYLKTLVTPEVIDGTPTKSARPTQRGASSGCCIYFRRQPQVDKYAITVVELYKAYRIVALSGHRGVPPRVVEDKVYASAKEAFPRRLRAPCAGSARVVMADRREAICRFSQQDGFGTRRLNSE